MGLASGLIAALAFAAPAPGAGYELVRSWEVESPSAIAVDGDKVYVTTRSAAGDYVTRYTPAGERVTAWGSSGSGPGQFESPTSLAVDPQGQVYVADLLSWDRAIQVFDSNGNLLGGGPVVDPSAEQRLPFDVGIDATGERYIAVGGDPAVLRYSAAGQGLAAWGTEGAGDGQVSGAIGVASDGRGNVYVADVGNSRIQRFANTGAYISQWGQLGTGPGQFISLSAVAVDGQGDVYASERGRIQKFDSSGRLLSVIEATAPTVAPKLVDVAVDAQGNVYAADDGNPSQVQVYRPDGTPPKTKITKAPKKKLRTKKSKRRVKVKFKSEPGASFECRLDKRKFKPCASPYKVKAKSKPRKGAKHRVQVRATDAAGNVERKPAKAKFRLIRKR